MEENRRKRLLWTGLIGSGVIALCCLMPSLVLLLGVIGLGAITGCLDYVLLPPWPCFWVLPCMQGLASGKPRVLPAARPINPIVGSADVLRQGETDD